MDRDYSKYSIPELHEALAVVDGKTYPENHAALERELQARKESGEFDRFIQEAREVEKKEAVDKVNFANKMRKVIAGYLVIAALYAITGLAINASSAAVERFFLILIVLLLLASFVGGVGLFLNKTWGHWTAVIVLALQVLKFQIGGVVFSVLSLVGIYVYVGANGDVGISALFDPGITLAFGSNVPWWVGVNIFVVPLIVYLFTAHDGIE